MPDDVGGGRPKLVVLACDAVAVGAAEHVPDLVRRLYLRKGSDGSALRMLRNHVVFLAADDGRKAEMRRHATRRLALRELRKPERLAPLAEHQRAQVLELEARSEQELALAIQQCYRHVFYPSRHRMETADVDLAHSAIDAHSTSDQPGAGQRHVARALADLAKLRYAEDEPDSPAYVRDRTPLRKGEMTTAALRNEFRRDPGLPMLVGDDVFIRGVRLGIEQGEYVYRRGDLLFGPGDPSADVVIDEQSVVFTMAFARNRGLWPRKKPDGPDPPPPSPPPLPKPDPDPPVIPPPPPDALTAEGVLRDALTQIWEQARGRGLDRIGRLTIRMFEAGDAFRLLGSVGAVQGAERVVTLAGGYETRDGGSFQIEFRGPVADAQPVREFLEPQLRDASARNLEAGFELTFAEGLAMTGGAAEKFTERVSRFAGGAALRVGDGVRGGVVMARLERAASVETPASAPRYELRVRRRGPVDAEYAIWQMPAPATPPRRGAHPPRRPRRPQPAARGTPRGEAPRPRRRPARFARPPPDPRLRAHRRPRPDARPPVPRPRPRCAAATTCGRWPTASRRWAAKRPPTGSAWPCTAPARGGC